MVTAQLGGGNRSTPQTVQEKEKEKGRKKKRQSKEQGRQENCKVSLAKKQRCDGDQTTRQQRTRQTWAAVGGSNAGRVTGSRGRDGAGAEREQAEAKDEKKRRQERTFRRRPEHAWARQSPQRLAWRQRSRARRPEGFRALGDSTRHGAQDSGRGDGRRCPRADSTRACPSCSFCKERGRRRRRTLSCLCGSARRRRRP